MKEHTTAFPLINYKLLPFASEDDQLTKMSSPINAFYKWASWYVSSYPHMWQKKTRAEKY